MSRPIRVLIVIYAFLLAMLSLVFLYTFIDQRLLTSILTSIAAIIADDSSIKWLFFTFLVFLLGSTVFTITYGILSGRLSRTRIRETDIGSVDIGVDAIESIALNSAKSAQVGIKSAKAHVFAGKKDAIKVRLVVVLYSNVEVPAMMSKVQERVKKDIERYTGISVEAVSVRVSRVEPVVARVER